MGYRGGRCHRCRVNEITRRRTSGVSFAKKDWPLRCRGQQNRGRKAVFVGSASVDTRHLELVSQPRSGWLRTGPPHPRRRRHARYRYSWRRARMGLSAARTRVEVMRLVLNRTRRSRVKSQKIDRTYFCPLPFDLYPTSHCLMGERVQDRVDAEGVTMRTERVEISRIVALALP